MTFLLLSKWRHGRICSHLAYSELKPLWMRETEANVCNFTNSNKHFKCITTFTWEITLSFATMTLLGVHFFCWCTRKVYKLIIFTQYTHNVERPEQLKHFNMSYHHANRKRSLNLSFSNWCKWSLTRRVPNLLFKQQTIYIAICRARVNQCTLVLLSGHYFLLRKFFCFLLFMVSIYVMLSSWWVGLKKNFFLHKLN